MDVANFSQSQKQALLDLLVLGMYSDGHLARAEDSRIQRLLSAMGFHSTYEHQVQFDASVTRVRALSPTPAAALSCATALALTFSTAEQGRQVFVLLADLLASDSTISEKETQFLSAVQGVFHK